VVDYYDDENMMTIVDYSISRTPEDINHPNVDKSIQLPPTPVKKTEEIVEESIFVTTRQGPFRIKAGELVEVLNVIEGGELVSIEVVTDNPYLATFLQMDDYRNKEQIGITAAELLMRGRDEYSEREFYVEDRRPDGMYVVKYHPRSPDKYKDTIKIHVRNEIRRTNQVFGYLENLSYVSRGGLPSPQNLGFLGGGYVTDPFFAAPQGVSSTYVSEALAKPINAEPYNVAIPNMAARKDTMLDLGASHPFVGEAGRCTFEQAPASGAVTVKFGEPGQKALNVTGAAAVNTHEWPGHTLPDDNFPSEQQIAIFAGRAEDHTAILNTLDTVSGSMPEERQRLFIRQGDTIYFPGIVTHWQRYNRSTNQFVDTGPAHNPTSGEPSGAILLTVSPGLPFKPGTIYIEDGQTETAHGSIGAISNANTTPEIIVKEITVRRRRKRHLVG
jgi:hypothetical protein